MEQPAYIVVMEIIRTVNPVKAAEIEQMLKKWRHNSSRSMSIVDNIMRDYHIGTNHMMEILDCLHVNKTATPDELERIFKQKCYAYTLKGPCIDQADVEKNMGNAKTTDDFKTAMKEVYVSFTDNDIDKLLSKLLSKRKLSTIKGKLAIAPYSCWATWSDKDPENPFEFVQHPNRVLKVLANMGLDHRQENKPHLLFIYPKTAVGELHIPTFADAGVYPYFNCSAPADNYGLTKPWAPGDYTLKGLTDADVKPRPEGVHLPVKLEDLQQPLGMIQP